MSWWNPFTYVNYAAKGLVNVGAAVVGGVVEYGGYAVGGVCGAVGLKGAQDAINYGSEVAGNYTKAGIKAVGNIATIGYDHMECALDSLVKGDNYGSAMAKKWNSNFDDVVRTAKGFQSHEIERYVD